MVAGITIPGSYAVRFRALDKETDREMISICVTCSPFLVVIPGRAFFIFFIPYKKKAGRRFFSGHRARGRFSSGLNTREDFLGVIMRAREKVKNVN